MVDFVKVVGRKKKGGIEVYPIFIVRSTSKHLMIRGGDFYAVWVEERGMWSTNEQDVIDLVDAEIARVVKEQNDRFPEEPIIPCYMWDSDSGSIDKWHRYCQKQMRDNYHMLDEKLIFSNDPTRIDDYASKRLSYPLQEGDISAWDAIMTKLYTPTERHKIEWAIGAIVTGESKELQKFMVLYGAAGTGKSTVINVFQQLFEGYTCTFISKALASQNNSFALEPFRTNPLVAIEHDGDLSRIEDNTKLNSLVSHEEMTVNEKFKATYSNRFKAFLIMGTNSPVKITNSKSGLLRRLIDVSPTGDKFPPKEYRKLTKQIKFELGAIAWHCRQVYLDDPDIYAEYQPINMMGASNDFYNFILDSKEVFERNDETTLKAAWTMYKEWCDDAKVGFPLKKMLFKEELKNYFRQFDEDGRNESGEHVSNLYSEFRSEKFKNVIPCEQEVPKNDIGLRYGESLIDAMLADCPAQYANEEGTPMRKWANVKQTLKDIDTHQTHYVKPPINHIVIDLDLKVDGKKCIERNLEEALKWPKTYAEVSKGGHGIHLHYIYSGDPEKLASIASENVEIKVFGGNTSLRRRLSLCNEESVATISGGLPLKEEKRVINKEIVQNEQTLRKSIKKGLDRQVWADTSSSINFIHHVLEEAYKSGMHYDVRDMYGAIIAFASGSTNQATRCLDMVSKMHMYSDDIGVWVGEHSEERITIFDIETAPNHFLVCWKYLDDGDNVITMLDPTPTQIDELLNHKLVGFNNLDYDNHMLYGCLLGYSKEQLFKLSNSIINAPKGSKKGFYEAKNISYTDIFDFAAKKQGLKKWEIELGLPHKEYPHPWNEPVTDDQLNEWIEYCKNDVRATEAVFKYLEADFKAREILADIAGMTPNDSTNSLTTRIVFGQDRNPPLVYTDLATGISTDGTYRENNKFEGYEFREWREGDNFERDPKGKKQNVFMATDIGFGGYIRSNPGMYTSVALLDVASLHPNSIRAMQCFGDATKRFTDILDARVAIKHGDYELAKTMLDGKLAPYLDDKSQAKKLSQALKIAINSVYGLTAAGLGNPFRDKRNENNIVALRGALFMRKLQKEVENRGYFIVAIKTDSIKIAGADRYIIDFAMQFAKQYGYTFEHEASYERMCQVNDADYIARYMSKEECLNAYDYIPEKNESHPLEWTVTGAKFAHPYVFKTLFTKDDVCFDDLCETKSVSGKAAIYLNLNETNPDAENLTFVGKVGLFTPVIRGGGDALRISDDGKRGAVSGTKGYRWLESDYILANGMRDNIDMSYFRKLADNAKDEISKYGDFEWFVSNDLPADSACPRDE